jgi:hypothetical protein
LSGPRLWAPTLEDSAVTSFAAAAIGEAEGPSSVPGAATESSSAGTTTAAMLSVSLLTSPAAEFISAGGDREVASPLGELSAAGWVGSAMVIKVSTVVYIDLAVGLGESAVVGSDLGRREMFK